MKFPIDLTPAQRAKEKLIFMVIASAAFNAVLYGIAYMDQFKIINVHDLIFTIISQFVLAVLVTLEKYVSAQGDVPLSTLLDQAKQEVTTQAAKVTPTVTLSPNQAQLGQSFSNVIMSATDASAAPAQEIPAVKPASVQAAEPNAPLIDTLPNISAVSAQATV